MEFAQKISTNDNVTYDENRQMYTIGNIEYFTLAQIDYYEWVFIALNKNSLDFLFISIYKKFLVIKGKAKRYIIIVAEIFCLIITVTKTLNVIKKGKRKSF